MEAIVIKRCHGSDASWKRHEKGVMEATVVERRHGSDASWKRHGKGVMESTVMEASSKRCGGNVTEVMRHGKRHGKCVMQA